MTTSYEKISSKVIKFNQGLDQLSTNTQLNLFIEFNNNVLKLLKQLTQDKIGLELIKILEETLNKNLTTTEYVKQLHCLLIGDDNNFINQQARKKYELGAKAFYDLNSWVHYGAIIGLLTNLGVFVTLALCLMITPALVVHLALIGIALIAGVLSNHIARLQTEKLCAQNYNLQQEHTKLLTKFDESISNQQEISLTKEEQVNLIGKSNKFYDSSNYYMRTLNDGYHYDRPYFNSPSLCFSYAGEITWLTIDNEKKFNAELNDIRQINRGLSSYELSSDQILSLITDNTSERHDPVLGTQFPSFKRGTDKSPFEAALRMKKLQFFYQERGEEIQQSIASLSN